ncbi:dihydrofolate reductase family protein [Mucilaginibacter pedocola]|uniref:Deaminase n=1 Tax=Mucilaginibacter pedocola TaxID=1792845 RepID=A0A1S9P6I3_9SPHI|nr:dihydrofolate reductase family protein [Mucilaginibacter pedocola]OOQ56564.1 deaminase [Mucilaginibacter pedocola]
MRKIRIFEHISLDGVIEHDDNYEYGAWTAKYRTPQGLGMLMEAYGSKYDLLLGRGTYDAWSAFWPKMQGNPMADNLNAATKYVATHRPEGLEWGPAEALAPDAIAGIRALKETDGPDLILSGSTSLTSALLAEGLADEVVLIVYPVILGRGKRLFTDEFTARELEFVSSAATPTGVLLNRYRYVGGLKG